MLGFEKLIWPSGVSLTLLKLTPSTGESNRVFRALFHGKSEELFLRMLLFLHFFQACFLFHLPHLTPLMDTSVYLNLSFDNLLFFPVEVCAAYIP